MAVWRSLLDEVMDDTIFEEEPIYADTRGLIPETVDCFGLPEFISKVLRFLFKTDKIQTVNTRYFLSTR
jgi:hypothetical protein